MARNASGTHSLPAGNPVVAGTAADPVAHNATMTDLSAEITDSLSRSGKGGMSAPLVITAGSASAPSIAPTGDTNTGIYASAADEIAITTGGTQRGKFSSAGLNVTGAMAATGAVSGATGTFTGQITGVGVEAGTGAVNGTGMDAGSAKITNVANGTAATDAATFGQLSVAGTITAGTDFTLSDSACFLIGDVVFFHFTATANTPVGSASWSSVATFPEGFRPYSQALYVVGIAVDAGTATLAARVNITTGGVVSLVAVDDGTSFNAGAPVSGIAAGDIVHVRSFFKVA